MTIKKWIFAILAFILAPIVFSAIISIVYMIIAIAIAGPNADTDAIADTAVQFGNNAWGGIAWGLLFAVYIMNQTNKEIRNHEKMERKNEK